MSKKTNAEPMPVEMLDELIASWPNILVRAEAAKWSQGLITQAMLRANGPKPYVLMNKIVFKKADMIAWLKERCGYGATGNTEGV